MFGLIFGILGMILYFIGKAIITLPVILFKTILRLLFSIFVTLPVTSWFIFADSNWMWIIAIAIPSILTIIITARRWHYAHQCGTLGEFRSW